ncbi:hypothetical protein P0E69_09385 [Chimaeribacter arupi]|uniref:hypothetical protein n=1 Tax=Chimaeribacter arupi TaxID=2060066 RepID=UPI0027121F64|nr:hypothetical protein [Chimaeribacter arupi]WKZ94059.1 hypothetical protein P0E69_09385 [Chimaeribacter arupi]
MAKTKPLTKAERAWLVEVQEVLNRCPSKRIAFFTIGDNFLGLHDANREKEISDYIDQEGGEWCMAAEDIGADFGGLTLNFPNSVHSTAG